MMTKRKFLLLLPVTLIAAALFTAGAVGVYTISKRSSQPIQVQATDATVSTEPQEQKVASDNVSVEKKESKPQAAQLPAGGAPSGGAAPSRGSQPVGRTNRLAGKALYVPPPIAGRTLGKAAGQPMASWFGEWSGDVRSAVAGVMQQAAAAGQVPVLVAYNIPIRDCGGYSSGGVASEAAYKQWIQEFAAGIGGGEAAVILEPDALAGIDCLSEANQLARYNMLGFAIASLSQAGAVVYVDAGNPGWLSAETIAGRFKQIPGYAEADGFALNVSNFYATATNLAYGNTLSGALGGAHFVIDTSRNGNGAAPGGEWCNPRGRALGERPSTLTGHDKVDAYVWAKIPGESDGSCNGGPSAGVWWQEYADELSRNAAY